MSRSQAIRSHTSYSLTGLYRSARNRGHVLPHPIHNRSRGPGHTCRPVYRGFSRIIATVRTIHHSPDLCAFRTDGHTTSRLLSSCANDATVRPRACTANIHRPTVLSPIPAPTRARRRPLFVEITMQLPLRVPTEFQLGYGVPRRRWPRFWAWTRAAPVQAPSERMRHEHTCLQDWTQADIAKAAQPLGAPARSR